MFNQGGTVSPEQAALAKAIMSPEFQIAFNKVKGSVPARTDVPVETFDACGQKAYERAEGGCRRPATSSARTRTAMPTRHR